MNFWLCAGRAILSLVASASLGLVSSKTFADSPCVDSFETRFTQFDERQKEVERLLNVPQVKSNPFLQLAARPDGPLDFSRLSASDFRAGIRRGMRIARARYAVIRATPGDPTFANTIDALENASAELDQVLSIFHNFLSVRTNPSLDRLNEQTEPLVSRFSNEVLFDPIIFSRVKFLYDKREQLSLTDEQMVVLESTYRGFAKSGALLSSADKKRISALDTRIGLLSIKFEQNRNQARDASKFVIESASQLEGVPQRVIDSAKRKAESLKLSGWVFTTHPGSISMLLAYSNDRAVRERAYHYLGTINTQGPFDNRGVVIEIAKLRHEHARILGFDDYASMVMADRMAKSPDQVLKFFERLRMRYKPAAERDLAELTEFAGHEIRPWDIGYYSEKLMEQRYGYSDEDLRPYFQYDQVLKGAFYTAKRLFGVEFVERRDLTAWDPAVGAFQVLDRDGSTLGYFYHDPFSRLGKRGGAWMNTLQDQGEILGQMKRPIAINVMNFPPPDGGSVPPLSLDNVTTIFHELGHGLHGLLSQVHFRSVSGTNVAWDFVEFPSQLFETWALHPDVLAVYARHAHTGAVIPPELVEKVKRARNFQAGWNGLAQLRMPMLDLAWHSSRVEDVRLPNDVARFEATLEDYTVVKGGGNLISPTLGHIFAGGYAGGLYSYRWADAIVADAYEFFAQAGGFHPTTADRYRRMILERGGTRDESDMYREFRGRDPDPEALLRREGLL